MVGDTDDSKMSLLSQHESEALASQQGDTEFVRIAGVGASPQHNLAYDFT